MQNFTDIPSTRTLSDSLAEILNNDKTALSLSSGTAFPTTNLQLGMPCYRSDQQKLYILTQVSPSAVWKLWMDFTGSEGKAPNAEAVDGVDSSTIVQNTRQIIAGTGLSGGGDLSTNRTLSLAAGAAASNLGYNPVNKAGDTMTGRLTINRSNDDGTILVGTSGGYGALKFDGGTNASFFGHAEAPTHFNSDALAGDACVRGQNGVSISGNAGSVGIRVDSSGRLRLPYQPAFMATVNADYGQLPDTPASFTNVLYNIGSHYNASNSTFTAPVSGRYVFLGNVRLNANLSYVYAEPYVNGTRAYAIWNSKGLVGLGTGEGAGFTASAFCVVLSLSANDSVRIGCGFNNSNAQTLNAQSYWCMYLLG